MHMRVIYVGRHLSRTLKKFPCPSRGSNRGPFDPEASTLPRAIKAGLYRKAVQVYYIPNLYPVTLRKEFSPIGANSLLYEQTPF